jgi:hypothetical protein
MVLMMISKSVLLGLFDYNLAQIVLGAKRAKLPSYLKRNLNLSEIICLIKFNKHCFRQISLNVT